jgi:AcrR family transcriptional regulator
MAKPRRRIRLENDERRAQILQLARNAFSARSYDEVSIDDLAREAKISKGLLYHYFPTKRDLYIAGLSAIAEDLVRRVTSVPTDLPPIERVRNGLDAYLDHVHSHARAFVSLMRGGIGSDPEVAAVVESVRQRMAAQFFEGSPLSPPAVARFAQKTIALSAVSVTGSIAAAQVSPVDTSRTVLADIV